MNIQHMLAKSDGDYVKVLVSGTERRGDQKHCAMSSIERDVRDGELPKTIYRGR